MSIACFRDECFHFVFVFVLGRVGLIHFISEVDRMQQALRVSETSTFTLCVCVCVFAFVCLFVCVLGGKWGG